VGPRRLPAAPGAAPAAAAAFCTREKGPRKRGRPLTQRAHEHIEAGGQLDLLLPAAAKFSEANERLDLGKV
jgi:hypothetical protein